MGWPLLHGSEGQGATDAWTGTDRADGASTTVRQMKDIEVMYSRGHGKVLKQGAKVMPL
ncbi:hypothetical protein NG895_05955 [Aeoliella sp. ICT_H6.2]|uniref:Uncharacterized protein n=1 Tax=Aeoliella straminimaris TaxID=2954799 RepID=A0A9X2F703_9BACT|nr:hypothetical protein [Aeoliella straminimaris]MCO6043445.1 hypothetical protein [Aeoliella straminimaris]